MGPAKTKMPVRRLRVAPGLMLLMALSASPVRVMVGIEPLQAQDAKTAPYDPSKPAPPVLEPADYRTDDYRKPVPATLKGATVLAPDKASEIWTNKGAVFIDVYPKAPKPDNLPAGTFWREPTHQSIENATWLPNVGYGVVPAATEDYFKKNLEALTTGDKSKPVVFFCLRNCWMSWNAAKRALTYGYKNVMWFPDGTDAWQEIGQPVVESRPAP
jgi:PQQ-dependent catabolism-associated CXXCW motif protein